MNEMRAEHEEDRLAVRLAEIEQELAERRRYRGWRSAGDYIIEQRLAVEAGRIADELDRDGAQSVTSSMTQEAS